MKKIKASFAAESALCAAFVDALPEDWTAYPETKGFDIVVVHASGVQIGVEAKLTLNAKVVCQIMPSDRSHQQCNPGPDFRAVLVPYGVTSTLASICGYLGITVISMHDDASFEEINRFRVRKSRYWPDLPDHDDRMGWHEDWFDSCPWQRLDLPDYIPDVAAGVSSPLRLTVWKVKAIKLAVTMEKRGYLTRADFKHHGVSITRWTQPPGWSWLEPTERRGVYRKREGRFPDFRRQHPTNYDEIEADYDRWKAPEPVLPPLQGALFGEAAE